MKFNSSSLVERIVYSQIEDGELINTIIDAKGRHSTRAVSYDWRQASSYDLGRGLNQIFNHLAVSQDGEHTAVSTLLHRLLKVSDRNGVSQIQYKPGNTSWTRPPINEITFLPTGKNLFAAALGKTILIFQEGRNDPVYELSVPKASRCVSSIAASDGLLASGSCKGEIMLWDYEAGQLLKSISVGNKRITSIAVSSDGSLLAAYTGNGEIIAVDLGTFRVVSLTSASKKIKFENKILFSPDGKYLVSNSCHHLAVWETDRIKRALSDNIASIDVTNVMLNLYQNESDQPQRYSFTNTNTTLTYCVKPSLSISPNSRVIAAMSSTMSISFYDIEQASFLSALPTNSPISDMSFDSATEDTILVLLSGDFEGNWIWQSGGFFHSKIEAWRPKEGSSMAKLLRAP